MIQIKRSIILSIFTLLIVLYLIQIKIITDLGVVNIRHDEITRKIKQIQAENDILNQEILKHESFTTIEQEAHGMGLTEDAMKHLQIL